MLKSYEVSYGVFRYVKGKRFYTRFIVGHAYDQPDGQLRIDLFTIPTGQCPIKLYLKEVKTIQKAETINEIGGPPKFKNP